MEEIRITSNELKELFAKGEIIVKDTKIVCNIPAEYGKHIEKLEKFYDSLDPKELFDLGIAPKLKWRRK